MCSQVDDPSQHDVVPTSGPAEAAKYQAWLNDREAEAFRAYMHGLDRQAAIALGEDPDTICPRCGDPKAPDAKWCPSCTDWQQRWDETPFDQEC